MANKKQKNPSNSRRKRAYMAMQRSEAEHLAIILNRGRQITRKYEQLYSQVAVIGLRTGWREGDNDGFFWKDHPAASKEVDKLLKKMSLEISSSISDDVEDAWKRSNDKCDDLVDTIVGNSTDLPADLVAGWKMRNLEALTAFQKRKVNGMNLSQRVWNFQRMDKEMLELALEVGIGSGRSAAALSRDIRASLMNPDALFRRVRDKSGQLRLSKAAEAYHPGQGVYRSAYMNALRMTATETNMAYRMSDCTRYQQISFVLGTRICLSNNHTLNGQPFHDICDELAGDYPVWFDFAGWHPFCRCHTEAILPSDEEMREYKRAILLDQPYEFKRRVTDLPPQFNDWLAKNYDRVLAAEARGTQPYFIRNNFANGIEQGLTTRPALPTQAASNGQKKLSASVERAREKRHAERDTEKIRTMWENRAKLNADGTYKRYIEDIKIAKEWGISTSAVESAFETKGMPYFPTHHASMLSDIYKRKKEWDVYQTRLQKMRDAAGEKIGNSYAISLKDKKAILDKVASFEAKYGKQNFKTFRVNAFYAEVNKEIKAAKAARQAMIQEWEARKTATINSGFSKEQLANFAEIEKRLGIKRGAPMNIEMADHTHANPKNMPEYLPAPAGTRGASWFTEDPLKRPIVKNPNYSTAVHPYEINCATCTPTYVLRSWGFDVTAGPRGRAMVDYLSQGFQCWEPWLNKDGSKAAFTSFNSWMANAGRKRATEKVWMDFMESQTKDPGIYGLCIGWKNSGHMTVLQRLETGELRYIEPQLSNLKGTYMDFKDVRYLARHAYKPHQHDNRGIMRLDDKLFDVNFLSIFDH